MILPTVATPTGVFLLRQYMLTIPDELIEAARMDHASEWKIYWRIVLPLPLPALAVLAIFSVMWRWNDFLWPLIVLSRKELYTLQIGLSAFSGELNVQWHYVLAMTVVSMIPVVAVFAFLQRFITIGHRHDGLEMSGHGRPRACDGITKILRPGRGDPRRRPRRRGWRVRRLRRTVRLRQVHAAAHHRRAGEGRAPARSGSTANGVNDVAAADRGLAMVFQSYALYPHMSVRQNLAFGLENTRTPRAEIEARVAEAARMLRIEALLRAASRGSSRAASASASRSAARIVRRPGIFLLDEPLSNLDAELRVVDARRDRRAARSGSAATMIYVTHDQVEAMTLADRIVVLNAGRIEQIGTPLDLFNEPANRFVAGFIGSPRMNFVEGTVAGAGQAGAAVNLGGRVPVEVAMPLAPGEKLTLGVRPRACDSDHSGRGCDDDRRYARRAARRRDHRARADRGRRPLHRRNAWTKGAGRRRSHRRRIPARGAARLR